MGLDFDKAIGFKVLDEKLVKYLKDRGFKEGLMNPSYAGDSYNDLTIGEVSLNLGFDIEHLCSESGSWARVYISLKDCYIEIEDGAENFLGARRFHMSSIDTVEKLSMLLDRVTEYIKEY